MPRQVLHYVDGEVYGGCEEAALHLMASLDRARYDPVLLHHSGPGAAPLEAGAARLGIPMRAVPRPVPGRRLTGALALWRAVRAVRPAIVHVHLSWPLACRYGVVAARLAGVPAVGTAQLYLRPGRPREARLALSPLRRIIAVSEEVRSRYERELGVGAHRLVVVRNGIMVAPTPPAPNAALRAELVRGRPDYLVFTPARLHPQKGHAYLLEAAALVPEVTLVLAGDGPLRGELEDRARELGIAGRCLFLGHRTDVAGLLAVADLFVLPSLFEGLPVSVLEAMAAGRPVIATAIGGTDEAVAHESTGLLVPPHDPVALAAAIRRLRADPVLARRLAMAGRGQVEREFSAEVTARQVMRVYDGVLGHG